MSQLVWKNCFWQRLLVSALLSVSVPCVAAAGLAAEVPVASSTEQPLDSAAEPVTSTVMADGVAGTNAAALFSLESTEASALLPVAQDHPIEVSQPAPTAFTAVEIPELASMSANEVAQTPLEATAEVASEAQPIQADTPIDTPTDAPADPAHSPANPAPTDAVTPSSFYDPNARLQIPPNSGEGRPIARVYIYVSNPSGDVAEDEAVRRELAETFGLQAGGNFSPLFADQAVQQVRQLPFVAAAGYQLYESDIPGTVIVALLVTVQPETSAPPAAQPPRGLAISGDVADFPTLYQTDRGLFKFILNGSTGVFSDTDAWFGNPQNFVAGPYLPNGTITWGELSIEPGLAGITQVGDTPLYVYGAATYLISSTVQPDIFQDGDRLFGGFEQLYGGFLHREVGSPFALNFSVGRQKFQLNQGFLFSQFSGAVNAAERGGSYLNPRTAYEMTVLANLILGDFRLQGFFLQPNQLPSNTGETQYLGANLSYNNGNNLEAGVAYITIPQSPATYLLPDGETAPREGLQVINPRVQFTSLFGVEGLWLQGEYAYEFSSRLTMSAQAGYAWLGYTAQNVPWRPGFSYRFSGFSGDNPETSAYERFDPLQAGGLADWLQGLSLGKVFNNSNNFSHRVSFDLQPMEPLSLSLVYYYRYADQLNNLGGRPVVQNLQSRDLGQEVQLLARYSLSNNFLLQFLSSIAFPGEAIRQAVTEETNPWFTVQLSAYMFF